MDEKEFREHVIEQAIIRICKFTMMFILPAICYTVNSFFDIIEEND